MSKPSLYAVEINGQIVTVRAEVWFPSARESAEGEAIECELHTIGGRDVHTIEAPDADWDELEAAVIDAAAERRAAAREGNGC